MDMNNFLTKIVILYLLMSSIVFSQTPQTSIGIDLGSSILQRSDLSIYTNDQVMQGTSIVPQNIRAFINHSINPYAYLHFAIGYGRTSTLTKINVSYETSAQKGEWEIATSGFPIESGIMIGVPISNNDAFSINFGVLFGYYSYIVEQVEIAEIRFGTQTEKTKVKAEDVKISGFAQSFVIGASYQISDKIKIHFEASKLGTSFLRLKQDIVGDDIGSEDGNQKIGELSSDFNASSGLNDLALTIGFSYQLGQTNVEK